MPIEMALHKDLQLQIQFLEEQLASRRARRKSGRRSINPSSPKIVKAKQKIPETLPAVHSSSVNKEDPKEKDGKESTLSAEEATDRFIAELRQDISMRKSLGKVPIAYNTVILNCVLLSC